MVCNVSPIRRHFGSRIGDTPPICDTRQVIVGEWGVSVFGTLLHTRIGGGYRVWYPGAHHIGAVVQAIRVQQQQGSLILLRRFVHEIPTVQEGITKWRMGGTLRTELAMPYAMPTMRDVVTIQCQVDGVLSTGTEFINVTNA